MVGITRSKVIFFWVVKNSSGHKSIGWSMVMVVRAVWAVWAVWAVRGRATWCDLSLRSKSDKFSSRPFLPGWPHLSDYHSKGFKGFNGVDSNEYIDVHHVHLQKCVQEGGPAHAAAGYHVKRKLHLWHVAAPKPSEWLRFAYVTLESQENLLHVPTQWSNMAVGNSVGNFLRKWL